MLIDERSKTAEIKDLLGLDDVGLARIRLLKAVDLPESYKKQYAFLGDNRLDEVTIAVVPDDQWVKGDQPSESSADKLLILVKQSYFEASETPDQIAWLCHELAHCQELLDSASAEEYQANMQTFAFEDLKTENPYPNNPVEKATFTKQFQFLKTHGMSREKVAALLSKNYHEDDFPFFNRLLDSVY